MAEPVFYDPRRARWKRLRRLFDVTAVVVSVLIVFFVYTALRDEQLPELLFFPQKRAFKALKENEKQRARDRVKKAVARSHRTVEAGRFPSHTEPGRRHPGGFLCAVGCSELFFPTCLRAANRPSLSRLAACSHSRRTHSGSGRPDQQIFRRSAGQDCAIRR